MDARFKTALSIELFGGMRSAGSRFCILLEDSTIARLMSASSAVKQ
jgi:hypothetical protein